ncbi:PTS transporter subunit EIIC [Staphylococcus aureus]
MAQLKDGVPFIAGAFTTGKYPFMMFGLPAAAFAIYNCTTRTQKSHRGWFNVISRINCVLTGITEPLIFHLYL